METNQDKEGLETTSTAGKDFENELAAAIESGDSEAISRLMAADTTDEEDIEESKDDTEDTSADKSEQSADETDENKEEADEESAPPAAESAEAKRIREMEQEIHRLRSDAGRVPFLQRRLAELERGGAVQRTARPSESKKAQEAKLPEDLVTKIEKLREIDPDVADTMEQAALAAQRSAMSFAEDLVTERDQRAQDDEDMRFYYEQKAELARLVPQHEQIFALPQWAEWKASLTPGRRALTESGYADEMAQAIYAFAADMQARGITGTAPEAPAPAKTPDPAAEKAAAVSGNREARLNRSANTKTEAPKKDEPESGDAAFKAMYDKIAKDAGIIK